MKATYYENYIQKLKDKLYKDLFITSLSKIKKINMKDHPQTIHDATQYYQEHYQDKPKKYKINRRSTIQYEAKNNEDKTVSIAKGTFYLQYKPSIVNFYEVISNYNGKKFETYRFGTPLHYFHDVQDIITHFKQFQSTKKKFISISLITPCNTPFCKTVHSTFKHIKHFAKPLHSAYDSTLENKIIDIELKANNHKFFSITYYTILFPLTQQHYKGVGHRLISDTGIYKFKKSKYKQMIKDKKVAKLYDFIHLDETSDGETGFKSIVQMTCYYYLHLRQKYALGYHCRSGKDRTSVFDAIVQSTFYYISSLKHFTKMDDINESFYEMIGEYSKKFLMYGLIIAFYSTGIVGLKLKTVPIAKYIFRDDIHLFDRFVGDSKYAKT
jgi:hypothetical protein